MYAYIIMSQVNASHLTGCMVHILATVFLTRFFVLDKSMCITLNFSLPADDATLMPQIALAESCNMGLFVLPLITFAISIPVLAGDDSVNPSIIREHNIVRE